MPNEFDVSKLADYSSLSDTEKALVDKILNQYKDAGQSETYNKLNLENYSEKPADIITFLHDPLYLGKALIDASGRYTVFPYWEKMLQQLFPNEFDTAYRTLVLSGAIGLGKSFVADICIAYMLHRMMCLKDPYVYYGLQPIDVITFSVLNITIDAAKGVAWSKLQEMLQLSPWFMARGKVVGREELTWVPPKGIELVCGSQPRHIIGRAVFASFEDEVSFQINKDIEQQKEKAMKLISAVDARMQSRFMKGEYLPTLHILASSKRTEQSFLESYIDEKKKNQSKTTLIIDEPQWVIRTDKDSPNKFFVAVGDKYHDSEVLPLTVTEDMLRHYRDNNYRILEVPMGYREKFIDDIDIALTDIAGISTSRTTRYISGSRLKDVRKEEYLNPFTKDVITVGDNDDTPYSNYFDMQRVPTDLMYMPLYIHLDMSVSGDKTGIAGTWIIGKKPSQPGQPSSKELYYRLAFSVSIQAPKGYQISFEKNRQFIRWLRDQAFNVQVVSSDTFQSVQILQMLRAEGFETEIISVDRVDSESRVCLPYQYLKSTIYDKRIEMYYSEQLTEELIGLERDNNGRIDHSPSGINSKDAADALCGSVFSASKHADQFALDYGEDLDTVQIVNVEDGSAMSTKEQVSLEFEQELQKMFNPRSSTTENKPQQTAPTTQSPPQTQQPQQRSAFMDFGFGPAQTLDAAAFINDDILLW